MLLLFFNIDISKIFSNIYFLFACIGIAGVFFFFPFILSIAADLKKKPKWIARKAHLYDAEIMDVTFQERNSSNRTEWRSEHGLRYWSVHVRWQDDQGHAQEGVIDTRSPRIGRRCQKSSHILIVEVPVRTPPAPHPATFTTDPYSGQMYYTQRDKGNNRKPAIDHELMIASEWKRQMTSSRVYNVIGYILLIVLIVLCLAAGAYIFWYITSTK